MRYGVIFILGSILLIRCDAIIELKKSFGVIRSPGYPQPYKDSLDITWHIVAPKNYQVVVYFTVFDLEDSYDEDLGGSCVYDYVQIKQLKKTRKFCGNRKKSSANAPVGPQQRFRSETNAMTIRFVTDYSNPQDYLGFEARYFFQVKSYCGKPKQLFNVPNSKLLTSLKNHYTYGDVVKVKCNKWYEKTFGVLKWRCSDSTKWIPTDPKSDSSQIPVCSPICGIKNKRRTSSAVMMRIAGGKQSTPNEWPWLAFINIGRSPSLITNTNICSGALINSKYVLTAANCITNMKIRLFHPSGEVFPNRTHVWLGVHNRANDYLNPSSKVRSYRVEKITRHPDYNRNKMFDADFALLRLADTVVMNDYVRPVCLPSTSEDFKMIKFGTTVGTAAGWGLTGHGGHQYDLNQIKLPIIDNDKCWKAYQWMAKRFRIRLPQRLSLTNNMFCAGHLGGGLGSTCAGDSGGPIVIPASSSTGAKFYSHGLVSFGISRGNCGTLISYTGFAYLNRNIIKWINEVMED